MIETAKRVVKELEDHFPLPPGPITTAVKIVLAASAAHDVIGAIHDEVKDWDWPWSS